ncbi:ABC transporter ATP-binding protein [Micromonospora cathayae]|uniref:ABC transporter ATP-binding protein n=1 Tax=Micromonospora cathayae TaxID=3028804 RepID=A0ABY7ZPB4_9ACTN|nr:ABC transporter ATP-binding protein [Micromonospora sp. HUAS 3]WDZ83789.1 ABC transporter ATP-binding protein [Micromonospora sp. HUAS 3]
MTGTPPLLSVRGLTKRFGGVTAVDHLDLDVPRGSIVGLMGPNGAGKTTVLNMVSGFLRADSGTVTFDGTDITAKPTYEVGRLGIARTYQNLRMFTGLSVLDHVLAGLHTHRRSTAFGAAFFLPSERAERRRSEDQARALLARVGLTGDPTVRADALPYGEQRRVELARALATDPTLLLLDEPTAGMNTVESRHLGDLLVELRDDGLTLMLIEHNIDLVLRYCEQAAVMDFGKLLISGPPDECVADQSVREAYLGRAHAHTDEHLGTLREDRSGS